MARARYRAGQVVRALRARANPPGDAETAAALGWLPERAAPLFLAMPANDRRHSLAVLHSLQAAGHADSALMQAALLHDAAKAGAGITLAHRVAFVLAEALFPGRLAAWAAGAAPPGDGPRRPFWVLANHPRLGAEMAAEAGCDAGAVALIRHHQSPVTPDGMDPELARALAALRAADGD